MQPDEVLLETNRFRVVRHCQTLADGTLHTRETIQHPGAVAILPVLEGGELCLIRNYRIAVGETLLEIPAGTLGVGEDPLAAAKRELTEETGYQAARWKKLGELLMSPGILHERMHLYLASDLTPGPQQLEAGEEIQLEQLPVSRVLEKIRSGEIVDAKTVAAVLYYVQFEATREEGAPSSFPHV